MRHPRASRTQIDSILRSISARQITIVAGDFNAKTGTAKRNKIYHSTIGKHGKGQVNENGYHLLNFAKINNLKVCNTFFKHKPSHITTWEAPEKTNGCIDRNSKTPRNNRYRNQIDYILIRKHNGINITDARSYGGMLTTSDHKLVMVTCTIKWPYLPKTKYKAQLNIDNFQNHTIKKQYQNEITEKLSKSTIADNNQNRWTQIVEIIHETAAKVLGTKPKHRFHANQQIKELSEKQKTIKQSISNTENKEKKHALQKERNNILNNIHKLMKEQDEIKITAQLEEIERTKNNSSRMFQAIKQMQKFKPKIPLLIKTSNGGYTVNEKQQAKLISTYFQKQFNKNATTTKHTIEPKAMDNPFTSDEINEAIKLLRNNKSAGDDGIKAEMLKHAPSIIHHQIAKIYNCAAETGEHPHELVLGIITALQKPGKQRGPVENLRPITLLSMLRKILAICMKQRIIDRLDAEIPPSQAAYRTGRSTTEHVFAAKLLAQKATSSANYPIHLLMLDMSKAFDTVNREILMKELSKVIKHDELHLINIMINTKIQVRCGNTKSEIFTTDTGVPQGDGLSANEFTFYLSKALYNLKHEDHNYNPKIFKTPAHVLHDHFYCKPTNSEININMEYADDISFLTTDINTIEHTKLILPEKLLARNLHINETKTEQYTIKRDGDNDWKRCKLLGTLLDTEEDIKRRKGLAISTINTMKEIFYGDVSIEIKTRSFNCYVGSVFLYNSETWVLTKSAEQSIDSFHRKLMRIACLNVKWPNTVSNKDVYEITKQKPWSNLILKRQLSWLGHMSRLPDDTPVKLAFQHAQTSAIRPRGRPQTTWLSMMKKRVTDLGLEWDKACELTNDRAKWNTFIEQSCSM